MSRRMQDLPLFKQLDAGVRFIDLRVGENNGEVQLYHGGYLHRACGGAESIDWPV